MMAPNVLEDCTPLYVRRLSLYYLISAMIVTTDNRTMMITYVTSCFVIVSPPRGDEPNSRQSTLFVISIAKLILKIMEFFMQVANYTISKLPYIENGTNEIMERYQIRAQYETEPPHGDAIYSITIKGKPLPFWIYGRDVTFIGSSMVMVESVRCKTWNPIESIIIDLENEVYAILKEWYTDISFVNNRIELTNQVVKVDKRILNDFEQLEWIRF